MPDTVMDFRITADLEANGQQKGKNK
jgi:hypothetical protein